MPDSASGNDYADIFWFAGGIAGASGATDPDPEKLTAGFQFRSSFWQSKPEPPPCHRSA